MSELKELTCNLLEYLAVEYENKGSSIEALLPDEIQKAWNVADYVCFEFEDQHRKDAIAVTLESDWLEKFIQSLKTQGRSCFVEPEVAAFQKIPDMERLISKELVLLNAIYKTKECKETTTCYSTTIAKAIATSDEKKEDLLTLTVNESNSLLSNHLTDLLLQSSTMPVNGDYVRHEKTLKTDKELSSIFSFLFKAECNQKFSPFLNGMERRMRRDLDRLWQYYTDMQNQILEKVAPKWKTNALYDIRLEKQKLQSIEREYNSKIADLQRKYSISLEYEVLQWSRARLPVYRVEVDIQRRKNFRKIFFDYNPLSRKLDSLHCEVCGKLSVSFEIEDDTLKFIGQCCVKKK